MFTTNTAPALRKTQHRIPAMSYETRIELVHSVISNSEMISPQTQMGQPVATIEPRCNFPDGIKIVVANSFGIKDSLKAADYSYDGCEKAWVAVIEDDADELAAWVAELVKMGVAVQSGCMSPAETRQLWKSKQ
jgi:hypothetical protein